MKRIGIVPRPNWQREAERLGLVFHTPEGRTYWDESACYHFSLREIEVIEAATAELQRLCLLAAQDVIDNDRFAEFHIPEAAWPVIKQAWEAEPPSIYGRFDLCYDGVNPPTLLEYNAKLRRVCWRRRSCSGTGAAKRCRPPISSIPSMKN